MLYSLFAFAGLLSLGLSVTNDPFTQDIVRVVNKCFNTSDDESFVWRCTDNSLWLFYYQDSNACAGTLDSTEKYGGCVQSDGEIYSQEAFWCDDAKAAYANSQNGRLCSYVRGATIFDTDNTEAWPINMCYNDNSQSYKWICYGNEPYQITYDDFDCQGGIDSNFSASDNGYFDYHCGSQDCGVKIMQYDTDGDTCNYDDSDVGVPGNSNPAYFRESGFNVWAIGHCNWRVQGRHKRSWKYVCTEGGDVEVNYYLDTKSCSGTAYTLRSYSALNYTINCPSASSTTSSKSASRTTWKECTDLGIDANDPLGRDTYCESCPTQYSTVMVKNLCFPIYEDPDEENYSFGNYSHYLSTCASNTVSRTFFFTDGDCRTWDAFVENDYADDINYVDGCTKGSPPSYMKIDCEL